MTPQAHAPRALAPRSSDARPQVGVVILTMGTRPRDLEGAIASVLMQESVDVDVVVVGNGWQPVGLPEAVTTLALPTNVGIPAGRNAGVPHVAGELLLFVDDDAALASPDFLAEAAAMFARDAGLGLIQPRVVDPSGEVSPRRWVPRLRVGDPLASGPATSLWEGVVVIRRSLWQDVGGWPDEFFYAHEGIDLVWRTWDAGYLPWYGAELVAHHPVIDPKRHAEYFRLNARNRVWLARRNLPLVLEPCYVGTWILLTILRERSAASLRAWFGGLVEGMRTKPTGRRRMRWSTVWAMTRAGRPPVI